MSVLLSGLAWVGARARWVLALGLVAALFIPGPGALLEGTVAFWVALLMGLAMTRIDLAEIGRGLLSPRHVGNRLLLIFVLMFAMPAVAFGVATSLGLPSQHIEALVYTTAAPPLGSAAAFCLMLGLNAGLALEATVLGAFVAPFSMPFVSRTLLGEAVPIETVEMVLRLAFITGTATFGALALRRILGADSIATHRLAFDGLSSICLVLFLFPLFQGLTGQIASGVLLAAGTLALALCANLGVQIVGYLGLRSTLGRDAGGATALVAGNRNAALALASLPPDPGLTLYVALYQFPMYTTPLVMRRIVGVEEIKSP